MKPTPQHRIYIFFFTVETEKEIQSVLVKENMKEPAKQVTTKRQEILKEMVNSHRLVPTFCSTPK